MKKILISITEVNLKKIEKFQKRRLEKRGYKPSRSAVISMLISNIDNPYLDEEIF